MGKVVKIGFIGAGFVGQVAHLVHYARNKNCRLVALCEAKPALRAAAQAHYGFEKTYADLKSFLNDPEIEAVVCVTRRQNTGPIALEVLKAGKHLIVEKPMCHSVAQGQRLVEQADLHQVKFAVGYMRRHDEGVQAAKTLIDSVTKSGELGNLNFVRVHCFGGNSYCGVKADVVTDEEYPATLPEWSLTPEGFPDSRAGDYATFTNVFSHNINLLRFLIPQKPEISHVNFGNPSGGIVVFDYGTFRATLEAGHSANSTWDDVIELFFDQGKIRLTMQPAFLPAAAASVEIYNANKDERPVLLPVNQSSSFQRQADAFLDCVANRLAPLASGADALEDLAWIEKIWQMELRRKNA